MFKTIKLVFTIISLSVLALSCNNKTQSSSNNFTVNKIAVTYVKSPLNVPSIVEKEK